MIATVCDNDLLFSCSDRPNRAPDQSAQQKQIASVPPPPIHTATQPHSNTTICSQQQRIEHLQRACAERNRKFDRHFPDNETPHMLTDLKHNLSYCFIYKAGRKNTKRAVFLANQCWLIDSF